MEFRGVGIPFFEILWMHFQERALLLSISPSQFVGLMVAALPLHLLSFLRQGLSPQPSWCGPHILLPQPPQVPEFISMCCHRRPFIRNYFPVKIPAKFARLQTT